MASNVGAQGAQAHEAEEHHYQPQVLTQSHQQITQDFLSETRRLGSGYKKLLWFFGLLFALGITGFIIRLVDAGGFTTDEYIPWAYLMVTYAFLLGTASSAPLLSVTQRMVKSHWRRPLGRASEAFAVVGVLSTLMFIPLLFLLPKAEGRRSIWFEWPGTPFWTDLLAVVFLGVLGLMILYVSSIPDLAAARDHDSGFRKSLGARYAGFWQGTPRQWKVLRAGLGILGALYFLLLITVHTFIAADFAEALVPGWRDAIFPTFHALSGLQAAIASTLIAMFLLHRFTGFRDYISVDQFWAASKILFGLSLLWGYFWFSGFIVYWYGRQPVEQNILKTFMFESYRWPFIAALILAWLTPFLILLWNFARKSMVWPFIASIAILFGTLADKIRIYAASFSIGERLDATSGIHVEPLSASPKALWPSGPDVMMMIGGIGGAIFLYLLVIRVIPALSIWEVSEGTLYRKTTKFLNRTIMVMGKPD